MDHKIIKIIQLNDKKDCFLHEAVRGGDIPAVLSALDNGWKRMINQRLDYWCNTYWGEKCEYLNSIELAIHSNHLEMVKILCDKGGEGQWLIGMAALYGDLQMVHFLYERHHRYYIDNNDGGVYHYYNYHGHIYRAWQNAIANGHQEVAAYLLSKGAHRSAEAIRHEKGMDGNRIYKPDPLDSFFDQKRVHPTLINTLKFLKSQYESAVHFNIADYDFQSIPLAIEEAYINGITERRGAFGFLAQKLSKKITLNQPIIIQPGYNALISPWLVLTKNPVNQPVYATKNIGGQLIYLAAYFGFDQKKLSALAPETRPISASPPICAAAGGPFVPSVPLMSTMPRCASFVANSFVANVSPCPPVPSAPWMPASAALARRPSVVSLACASAALPASTLFCSPPGGVCSPSGGALLLLPSVEDDLPPPPAPVERFRRVSEPDVPPIWADPNEPGLCLEGEAEVGEPDYEQVEGVLRQAPLPPSRRVSVTAVLAPPHNRGRNYVMP
jgi:hypothetical protein